MEPGQYLNLASLVSLLTVVLILREYVIPRAQGDRSTLLRSLVIIHAFRFVGLGMFIPGVAGPDLPLAFANPVAWGDYIAAILALLAFFLLGRESRLAIPAVWGFNVWGFADILYAGYLAVTLRAPDHMGVMFFVFTAYAPWLVVTHLVIFAVLLRESSPSGKASGSAPS